MNSATCIKIKTYAKILAFHVLQDFRISLCKGNDKNALYYCIPAISLYHSFGAASLLKFFM